MFQFHTVKFAYWSCTDWSKNNELNTRVGYDQRLWSYNKAYSTGQKFGIIKICNVLCLPRLHLFDQNTVKLQKLKKKNEILQYSKKLFFSCEFSASFLQSTVSHDPP